MMASTQISLKTTSHEALISITHLIEKSIPSLMVENGLVHVFVLHTTCGITINENADPDVVHDLLYRLNDLAPWKESSDRHMEGNSAAHLKSSLLGSSVTIPVKNGHMVLGTWQGVFFGEFDGPRQRIIHLTAIQ
jgi:secondary thiamine-phosphate synthase enzyme